MPYRSILLRPEGGSPSRRAFFALALGLAVLLGGPPLARSAEPEAEQKARSLYQAGNQAFSAGRYEEAYRQWEEGYRLSARPLFLVNMAHAERRRGELGKARVLYQKFLLVEPQSPLSAEVESVIAEIDAVLPPEDSPAPVSPPAAAAAPLEPSPPLDLTLPGVVQAEPSAPPLHLDRAVESPPEQTTRPFYRTWWFWTGIGAVVATTVAVGVLAGRQDGPPRHGSLGTVGTPP